MSSRTVYLYVLLLMLVAKLPKPWGDIVFWHLYTLSNGRKRVRSFLFPYLVRLYLFCVVVDRCTRHDKGNRRNDEKIGHDKYTDLG